MLAFLTMALLVCGTPVVENGQTPKGKAQTLSFVKNLRLSAEKGDDYLWPALDTMVAVNSKGHMFVADQKGNRIFHYGVDGALIGKIGSEGEGPGQFKGLKFVNVMEDDRLVAFDFQQAVSYFNLFDANGRFVERHINKGMDKLLVNVAVAPNRRYFFTVYLNIDQAGAKMVLQTGILSMDSLEPKLKLSALAQPAFDPKRANDGKYWSERLADEIKAMVSNRGVVAFDDKSRAYVANSGKYEITVYDTAMKPTLIVRKQHKPVPFSEVEVNALMKPLQDRVMDQLPPQIQAVITDAVMKKAVENAKLPPGMNPVQGIIPMADGKFLVVSRLSFATAEASADIFSKEGQLLGSFSFPHNGLVNIYNSYLTRMVFKGKYAYTIENDEDGENYLTRYTYQLK